MAIIIYVRGNEITAHEHADEVLVPIGYVVYHINGRMVIVPGPSKMPWYPDREANDAMFKLLVLALITATDMVQFNAFLLYPHFNLAVAHRKLLDALSVCEQRPDAFHAEVVQPLIERAEAGRRLEGAVAFASTGLSAFEVKVMDVLDEDVAPQMEDMEGEGAAKLLNQLNILGDHANKRFDAIKRSQGGMPKAGFEPVDAALDAMDDADNVPAADQEVADRMLRRLVADSPLITVFDPERGKAYFFNDLVKVLPHVWEPLRQAVTEAQRLGLLDGPRALWQGRLTTAFTEGLAFLNDVAASICNLGGPLLNVSQIVKAPRMHAVGYIMVDLVSSASQFLADLGIISAGGNLFGIINQLMADGMAEQAANIGKVAKDVESIKSAGLGIRNALQALKSTGKAEAELRGTLQQVGAAQEALHQRILAVEQSNCPAQVQALHKKVHALATSLTTLQLAPAGQPFKALREAQSKKVAGLASKLKLSLHTSGCENGAPHSAAKPQHSKAAGNTS